MSHQEWEDSLEPKVQGTWNLHNALADAELDFFLLFSSTSGIIGRLGQANYAAANTFLDAFVPFRHQLGLPASVLDIGVVGDIGYVSQNATLLSQLKASGAHVLGEQQLLDALHLAIIDSSPRPVISRSNPHVNRSQWVLGFGPTREKLWQKDARFGIYQNMDTATTAKTSANNELKLFLQTAAANPSSLQSQASSDFLAREIGRTIFSFMLREGDDVDLTQPLATIGMDSLMAIEMRSWWRQNLGFDISVLEMLDSGSIGQLGQKAADGLCARYGLETKHGDDLGHNKQISDRDEQFLAMKAA